MSPKLVLGLSSLHHIVLHSQRVISICLSVSTTASAAFIPITVHHLIHSFICSLVHSSVCFSHAFLLNAFYEQSIVLRTNRALVFESSLPGGGQRHQSDHHIDKCKIATVRNAIKRGLCVRGGYDLVGSLILQEVVPVL